MGRDFYQNPLLQNEPLKIQRKCNTAATRTTLNETLARHEQHKCDMRAAPVRRDKRDTSATQVKKFDFDNIRVRKYFLFMKDSFSFLKKKTYNP